MERPKPSRAAILSAASFRTMERHRIPIPVVGMDKGQHENCCNAGLALAAKWTNTIPTHGVHVYVDVAGDSFEPEG